MSRVTHINARCDEAKKERYIELSRRLGYSNFSEFLIAVLDSMSDKYCSEGWESHLVHLVRDRVVSADRVAGAPIATAAFPIVAPEVFWKHIEAYCSVIDGEDED